MIRVLLAFFAILLVAPRAQAHPHVFVGAKAEVIFDDKGQVIGINHAWTFDEQYSAFATMGFPKGPDGKFEAAKLAELAKVNVESLGDFAYFTHAKVAGKKVTFAPPQNYRIEQNGNAITLFLSLPLTQAQPGKLFSVEVMDQSYFVAFSFDPAADAVLLHKGPEGCKVTVHRPKADDLANYTKLSDQIFQQLSDRSAIADSFSNKAIVACP
jgi:ABC-type uncharacterized transport system substrate-binding protein